MANPVNVAKNRPAETAMPIATVLAALIAKFSGVEDTDTIFYMAIVLSFVPAGVTWLVGLIKDDKSEEDDNKLEEKVNE